MSRSFFAAVLFATALTAAPTSAASSPSVDDVIAKMSKVMNPSRDVRADIEFVQETAMGHEVRWKGAVYREAGTSARQRIVFQEPEDIAGTELVFRRGRDGKLDRIRMYLPALERTRTLRTEMRGAPFLGTDFDYENLGLERLDAEKHSLEGDSEIDGRPVHRVVSRPKNPAWAKRIVRFVDRETFVPLRTEYYDGAGVLYKVRTVEVDAGSPPKQVRITMETLPEDSSTELVVDDIRYEAIADADLDGKVGEKADATR